MLSNIIQMIFNIIWKSNGCWNW